MPVFNKNKTTIDTFVNKGKEIAGEAFHKGVPFRHSLLMDRVTRLVREKIAQNVAKSIFLIGNLKRRNILPQNVGFLRL
jgi:hypothetical protein